MDPGLKLKLTSTGLKTQWFYALSYKPCEPSSSKSHKKQLILCYLPEVANNKIVVPKHQGPPISRSGVERSLHSRANLNRRNLSLKDGCVIHYDAIVPLLIDRGDEVT
jgi:hypothetical protein